VLVTLSAGEAVTREQCSVGRILLVSDGIKWCGGGCYGGERYSGCCAWCCCGGFVWESAY